MKCKLCKSNFEKNHKTQKFCSQVCSNRAIAISRRAGFVDKDGYKIIQISGRKYREHRYVWLQAYGSIPKGYIVHHRNGIKLDNTLKNLQLMTRTEHQKYHLSLKNKGAFTKGVIPWNKGVHQT